MVNDLIVDNIGSVGLVVIFCNVMCIINLGDIFFDNFDF